MKTKMFTLKKTGKNSLILLMLGTFLLLSTGGRAQCSTDFTIFPGPNGSVQFSCSYTNVPNPSNLMHYWNFGDGNGTVTMGASTSHNYTFPGTFFVTLTINDSLSCRASVTKTVAVGNAPCNPSVYFKSFRDSTTAFSWKVMPQYPLNITNATWSWGDGSSTNGLYPTHTYSAAGLYTICVTITVSCGGTTTHCDSSYVYRSAQGSDNQMITVTVINTSPTGIKNNTPDAIKTVLHPNPSSGETYLDVNAASQENYSVSIRDISGKVLISKDIKAEAGTTSIPLGTEELKTGIYFVTLKNSTQSSHLRFVKN